MIFDENLKAKYPFATRFFELALLGEENRFAHGFILSGNNISLQYKMALDIARYLNCTKTKEQNCNCVDCSWIKDNAHPAVITISPIDYTEKERKKISVDQIRKLRNTLGVTSPYHRVVIITDAKEIEGDLPFLPPRISAVEKNREWTPYPLTRGVFEKSPSNAMLKILEEPSQRVTFFFLTQNKDDLLPTIVSRCQTILLSSNEEDTQDASLVEEFFNNFPYANEQVAILMAQKFVELSKETSPEKILNIMQDKLLKNLELQASDKIIFGQNVAILKKIEHAKKQLKSFVQLQNVAENLFLSLK